MDYITKNSDETRIIGKNLSTELKGGDIVLLHGDLGTGKTTLTKGIAEGFGIDPNDVVSPTFTLMQEYEIKKFESSKVRKLVHIDTYRLENEEQLIEIGVEDYLGEKNTICLIEWPEKIDGLLKDKKIINITIEHSGENGRNIKIEK
ncbi:tRNA (adenosine(37)-N6)-threonylcarbamoyltransferase complex ATPase subunit type 1 TsaE [Candidatus Parcubacteria bacterium]|jgi:tRNA threonylcarbamoyladenosine biosynthesis protein TsaE|nr:tRNA (adenosine(37)-N6)-threonylcarbamoyltransferase complex ATPase subunit type 1 TsaE [Candidatus Parcubacteria bacterium]MBT3948579.1 tRNA (adenosine(37)-N6)-threonylcarbamoyltransferase complex ATPase subunit type 1 TsaE [Candidatus Parcubacteria bacterium]